MKRGNHSEPIVVPHGEPPVDLPGAEPRRTQPPVIPDPNHGDPIPDEIPHRTFPGTSPPADPVLMPIDPGSVSPFQQNIIPGSPII